MRKITNLVPILAVAVLTLIIVLSVWGSMKQAAEAQRVSESEQTRDAEQLVLVRRYLTETFPEKMEEAYEKSDDELITAAECSVRFKTEDETEGAETEDEFHSKFQGIFTANLTARDSFDSLNTYEQSQKLQGYARNAFWMARQLFYEFPDYACSEENSSLPSYLIVGDTIIDFNQDWEFDVWVRTQRNTYEYYAFGAPMFDGYEINGNYTGVKDEDEEAAISKKSGRSSSSSQSNYRSSSGSGTKHYDFGSSSGSYSSSASHYSSADDYADENYEDYMDSGEYDDEDDAWEAAYDDFEDGDADW